MGTRIEIKLVYRQVMCDTESGVTPERYSGPPRRLCRAINSVISFLLQCRGHHSSLEYREDRQAPCAVIADSAWDNWNDDDDREILECNAFGCLKFQQCVKAIRLNLAQHGLDHQHTGLEWHAP